jgi:plasmid stabilization system protein ParE
MRVAFSPKAEDDLEEIGDYIARDNPGRALTFLDELRATCLAIAENPQAYPAQRELARPIRRAVYRRYLIFYSIQSSELRIERILHGARDVTVEEFDP